MKSGASAPNFSWRFLFQVFPQPSKASLNCLQREGGAMKTMALVCLIGVGVICTPRPTMCVTMCIVTVTAYHHCPGSKGITASGERVKTGMIAVSRDLESNLSLDFGDRVLLHGYGVFQVQDRMA